MMRKFLLSIALLIFQITVGQELKATVKVNFEQITNANTQIFKSLETSISDFINNTKWTNKDFQNHEKIDCTFYITITAYTANNFSANIQVQSSRPIYGSTYNSPLLNINDKEFDFTYVEFENLIFDSNAFTSNLVSVIAFYAHTIIGIDAATFSENSNNPSLTMAANIANIAQSSGTRGWLPTEKRQNRYYLINDLLSPTYTPLFKTFYSYHKALDAMSSQLTDAKINLAAALFQLDELHKARPNSFLMRVFFDAKADEIVAAFSGGTNYNTKELVNLLQKIAPTNGSKWAQIH